MSNITLGAATQQNLLSLQNINSSLDTTQNHLSTGLKVSSAVDNAVTYFQAQSLTNRANDLSTRKDSIDQGISSVTAATQGITSAIAVLQQMQGILQSAKTETASERKAAATQLNTLGQQLTSLLNDTSYQGLNLVNSSKTSLTLQFSAATTSKMSISGQNLLISAQSLVKNSAGTTVNFKGSKAATSLTGITFSTAVSGGKTTAFDTAYNDLQTYISTMQAAAQTLGSNVSFLQTRSSFTQQYMTTLNGGASKMTVADVNVESTNLVTLQTRQSLAIQSLSIATSSEQAVLRLFH